MWPYVISVLESPALTGTVVGLLTAWGIKRAICAIHGAVQKKDYDDYKQKTTDLLNNIFKTMATKTDMAEVRSRIDKLYTWAKANTSSSVLADSSHAGTAAAEHSH